MLEGIVSKVVGFLAREAIPFALSVLVRNGMKKVEKKLDEMSHNKD